MLYPDDVHTRTQKQQLFGSSFVLYWGTRRFAPVLRPYPFRFAPFSPAPTTFLAQVNLSDDGNDLVLKYQSITVHSVPERGAR